MALRVCPSCSRHARDATCPFCGAEIPQVGAVVTMPRVARTGLIGLAATAVVVGACSTAQPAYGIAIPDVDNDGKDDAPIAFDAAYGGPPVDASKDAAPDAGDGSADSGTD